jgi:hypothetical protein
MTVYLRDARLTFKSGHWFKRLGCSSSARPDRRIKIIRPPREIIAVAGELHDSLDAIVVGRQTALRIPFAIAATEARRRPRRDETYDRRENLPELVKRKHL